MKKVSLVLLCGVMLLGLCGCSNDNSNINSNDNNNSNKNYSLNEISLDCGLDNITFVNDKYLISNGQVYTYSDKKFSETDTKCKQLINDNIKYVGAYDYSVELFINDSNQIIKIDSEDNISYGDLKGKENEIINEFNANYFYRYYLNSLIIKDDAITLNNKTLTIPENEKILYAVDGKKIVSTKDLFIITNKTSYTIGVDENDKCNEYQDVECTQTLIKINKYDEFLKDYKDNITYFDGSYLITKDNKIYRTNFIG